MRHTLRGGAHNIYQLAAHRPWFFSLALGRVGMIVFALMVGLYSIVTSYLRTHHEPLPLILLLLDFAIILLGHAFLSITVEGFVVPAGGTVIALAHFMNYKCVASSKPAPKERTFDLHDCSMH